MTIVQLVLLPSVPSTPCWRIMTHHVLLYPMMPRIYGAMLGWDVPSRVDRHVPFLHSLSLISDGFSSGLLRR